MKNNIALVVILMVLIVSSAYAQPYDYDPEIVQEKIRSDLGIDDFEIQSMREIKKSYLGDLQVFEISFFI